MEYDSVPDLIVRVVLWVGRDRIVLVVDPTKRLPHFWGLPGGSARQWRTPRGVIVEDAAAAIRRETREETGLIIPSEQLRRARYCERQANGVRHMLYEARLPGSTLVPGRGRTGGIVRVFPVVEVEGMEDLLPAHRRLLLAADIFEEFPWGRKNH